MSRPSAIDVHQHLWPEELVDVLRARSAPPYLRGWTLHTAGEAPYLVDPRDHDLTRRLVTDAQDGIGLACLSLSAPLGIEQLPVDEARPLLEAWHEGVRRLPGHFAAWVSVPEGDDAPPELDLLREDRFVGLQLPATSLHSPAAWDRAAPLLAAAAAADKPVLVHPGPVPPGDRAPMPVWWPAVVDYVTQLQAAWWGWHVADGRRSHAGLRLVFAAGAGLAPAQRERYAARGGHPTAVDPGVFVDTSSYGPQGLDALTRVLGIDVLVLGSDRPYGTPLDSLLGDAATQAVRVTNPHRLLGLPQVRAVDDRGVETEETTWSRSA